MKKKRSVEFKRGEFIELSIPGLIDKIGGHYSTATTSRSLVGVVEKEILQERALFDNIYYNISRCFHLFPIYFRPLPLSSDFANVVKISKRKRITEERPFRPVVLLLKKNLSNEVDGKYLTRAAMFEMSGVNFSDKAFALDALRRHRVFAADSKVPGGELRRHTMMSRKKAHQSIAPSMRSNDDDRKRSKPKKAYVGVRSEQRSPLSRKEPTSRTKKFYKRDFTRGHSELVNEKRSLEMKHRARLVNGNDLLTDRGDGRVSRLTDQRLKDGIMSGRYTDSGYRGTTDSLTSKYRGDGRVSRLTDQRLKDGIMSGRYTDSGYRGTTDSSTSKPGKLQASKVAGYRVTTGNFASRSKKVRFKDDDSVLSRD